MSMQLAIQTVYDLCEDIDYLERRLDDLRQKSNDVLTALESAVESNDCHIFSRSKKLLKYISNSSDFNWCQIATSTDHTRAVLCHVIVQNGIMYGTNGVIVNFCETDLPDGVYESEGQLSKNDLKPPLMKNVVDTTQFDTWRTFKREEIQGQGETVNIFMEKYDRELLSLIIINKPEFKASFNENGALMVDIGDGRKAMIMCRREKGGK